MVFSRMGHGWLLHRVLIICAYTASTAACAASVWQLDINERFGVLAKNGDLAWGVRIGDIYCGSYKIAIVCAHKQRNASYCSPESRLAFFPFETFVTVDPAGQWIHWLKPNGMEVRLYHKIGVTFQSASGAIVADMDVNRDEVTIAEAGWVLRYAAGELFQCRSPDKTVLDVKSHGRRICQISKDGQSLVAVSWSTELLANRIVFGRTTAVVEPLKGQAIKVDVNGSARIVMNVGSDKMASEIVCDGDYLRVRWRKNPHEDSWLYGLPQYSLAFFDGTNYSSLNKYGTLSQMLFGHGNKMERAIEIRGIKSIK